MNDSDPPSDLDELKLVLQRSPLLRALVDVAPEVMRTALRDETYAADTVLFREGDPGDRAYAIWKGRLRVQHEMDGEAPLILREVLPGDVVGEVSLFDNRPRSATVLVVEDSRLISLSREDLESLLLQRPEASLALLAVLSYRLRSSSEYLIAATRSADYLARRIGGMSGAGAGPPGSSVSNHRGPGLGLLIQDLGAAVEGVTSGLTMLERALPADLDDQALDLLDLIDTHARHMALNLEHLDDWQRLESGEATLQLEPVAVGVLAEELAVRLTPSARPLKLQFDIVVQPDIPRAMADKELLKRMLRHLYQYAMRHAPPGTAIRVEVVHVMERELHISVFDRGATIPPEYREAIFEPFVQIPDEAGSGLGIELAACRAIIQAHGGRIWVEEGPGDQSNAFRITLPTGSSS